MYCLYCISGKSNAHFILCTFSHDFAIGAALTNGPCCRASTLNVDVMLKSKRKRMVARTLVCLSTRARDRANTCAINTHAHTHILAHSHTHTRTHALTHARSHRHTYTQSRVYTQTQTQTYRHRHRHRHIYTDTDTHRHRHRHADTHRRTQTQTPLLED